MENEFLIPVDFLLLMLGIIAVVTVIALTYCAFKKWRLHRLTSPRKDYYRSSGHVGHHRIPRIDKVDGYSTDH
jgi:uncharacterized membrane protein